MDDNTEQQDRYEMQIDELKDEVERLKLAVKDAFGEGWSERGSCSHDGEFENSWRYSEAKQNAEATK